jgi:hypothetical protein
MQSFSDMQDTIHLQAKYAVDEKKREIFLFRCEDFFFNIA